MTNNTEMDDQVTQRECPVVFQDMTCAEFRESLARMGDDPEMAWMWDVAGVMCEDEA